MYNAYYESKINGIIIRSDTGKLKTIQGVKDRLKNQSKGDLIGYVIYKILGDRTYSKDNYMTVERNGNIKVFYDFWN